MDVTIEPVTESVSGGALRLPRARIVPLPAPPASYTGLGTGRPAY